MNLVRFFCVMALSALAFNASAETKYRSPVNISSSYYGWVDHNSASGVLLRYYGATVFEYDQHHGTDIVAAFGTTIVALARGTVKGVNNTCMPGDSACGYGWGRYVYILHTDGRYTNYAHLSYAKSALLNLSVACGEYIGDAGATGYTQGNHVHFEVWKDSSGLDGNQAFTSRIDPLGGTSSSQTYDLWYSTTGTAHFPTTTCQP